MDLAPLRELARDIEFAVHGVVADVGGVATRAIWLTEETDQVPITNDMQKASPRRQLALRRDEIPTGPARGTVITLEASGFVPAGSWLVDAASDQFADNGRVVVVPNPSP